MRREHFEALAPVCPTCRAPDRAAPLRLADVWTEAAGHVVHGVIHCTNAQCWREYPVLDGVPILVPDLRARMAADPLPYLVRDDLDGAMAGVLGDCLGPGSAYVEARRLVAAYASDHWGRADSGAVGVLARGLALLPDAPRGPALDAGCAVGRVTVELAGRTGALALGLDLNFGLLRLAARVLREGEARIHPRRVGIVHDELRVVLDHPGRARADVWMADACAPPFRDGTFGVASSLQVVDSVADPRAHLRALGAVLMDGGQAVVATPYDWSAAVTPVEAWIGGHSQRAPDRGAPEPGLRALFDRADPRCIESGLALVAEDADVPWTVALHARAEVRYRCHVVGLSRARR